MGVTPMHAWIIKIARLKQEDRQMRNFSTN